MNEKINAAALATIVHSGYVVFRALSIRDDLGLDFWGALRLAAESELPLLPLYIAAALVLSHFWRGNR